MDIKKLAEEGCMKAGLSRNRSKHVASEVAAVIDKAMKKQPKKKLKDISEVKDTYTKDVKEVS